LERLAQFFGVPITIFFPRTVQKGAAPGKKKALESGSHGDPFFPV